MKSTHALNLVKLAALLALVVGLGGSAFASCGDSLSAMAAVAAHSQTRIAPQASIGGKDAAESDTSSVVGLWHIRFVVGDQTIQEAYQVWNQGGTEVHNPNVDPRTGNVCLGAWKKVGNRAYKLAHRVWSYDTAGTFLGTINLSESIYLGHKGSTHTGTFVLDFFDPAGNFQFEVPGNVVAERISVE
ncbi:MAG TPA: hypothetical protein VNW47_05000 [Terriglobales bacterium]|jgi:hypothetical protein|nr:hypothetical protein [Terriglobales bacterium]